MIICDCCDGRMGPSRKFPHHELHEMWYRGGDYCWACRKELDARLDVMNSALIKQQREAELQIFAEVKKERTSVAV